MSTQACGCIPASPHGCGWHCPHPAAHTSCGCDHPKCLNHMSSGSRTAEFLENRKVKECLVKSERQVSKESF